MRPLGAILFGHMGDRRGRKRALTLSIACMALPTLAIGLMPGYGSVGLLAPLVLVLLRLIQGLSIGGEGAGAAIFILEHNQNIKIGYLGGIITSSNFIGAFFATLVGLCITYFTDSSGYWRYAFILGGLLGGVGFYLRTKTIETPVFEALKREKEIVARPLLKALSENKKQMILSGCLGGVVGAFAYMILAFINLFFNKTIGLSPSLSLLYASLGIGSFILLLPVFGLWSDKVGFERSVVQACYSTVILAAPLFMLMSLNDPVLNIVSILVFSAMGAWICAPAYPIMLHLFPPPLRYSGIAFSFNMGIALFGGTAPILSTFLTKTTGLAYAPAFYLIGLTLLYIASDFCFFWRDSLKTKRNKNAVNLASDLLTLRADNDMLDLVHVFSPTSIPASTKERGST